MKLNKVPAGFPRLEDVSSDDSNTCMKTAGTRCIDNPDLSKIILPSDDVMVYGGEIYRCMKLTTFANQHAGRLSSDG
jgi:hypothetical protein